MMNNQKRIGIYGGSFDPIHIGHLNLAVEMLEAHHLDEVWISPTGSNPLKKIGCRASPVQRLAMVGLAIQGEPRFHILDIEVFQDTQCFTIDTLHILMKIQESEGRSDKFFVIMGDDSARSFHKWREPEEIIKHALPLIGRRTGSQLSEDFIGSTEVVLALEEGVTQIHIMDISSTNIRDRLSKKLFCGHLLPGKVLDYIKSHRLYL